MIDKTPAKDMNLGGDYRHNGYGTDVRWYV